MLWPGQVLLERPHAKGAKDAKEICQNKVIVELKSVEKLVPVHSKQVLTQLRLSERRLGLLINFGEAPFA